MPNVGKPSKGCKNCRDRKVKCDQKRPSCTQCIRINKECHGYRDPLSMMFKNESDVVVNKAQKRYEELSKKKKEKEKVPSSRGSESPPTDFSSSSTSSGPLSTPGRPQRVVPRRQDAKPDMIAWEMKSSLEDQAVGFFFANYVVEPSIVPRGQFDWLPELLNQPNTERVLQSSVNAAGLASLANTTKSPAIMKRAQEEYVAALAMTNRALQFKKTAIKDSTLISVILLGMYENFQYQDSDSLKAWARHTNGACALLRLRGEEQFKSSVGRRVLHQFYGTVLLVALESGTAVPPDISELWEKLTTTGDYRIHGKHWTVNMVRFMKNAISLSGDKTSDPVTIVAEAMKLDRELDEIKTLIPSVWKYETFQLEKPVEHVFSNTYHIYLDPWIAQMWNNLRACRMFLHAVIRRQLLKGSECHPPLFHRDRVREQIAASEQVMRAGAAGVCAAAPQILGQVPFPEFPGSKKSFYSDTCPELVEPRDPTFQLRPPGTFLNSTRPTGVHHLIWPLYAIGGSDLASPELTQWAIDQLYFIALRLGTRQAVVLAEELKQKQRAGSVSEISDDGSLASSTSS